MRLYQLGKSFFTFNSRVFPVTAPLVARLWDHVRIRIANLSMDSHPIHLHGYSFKITGTDGGRILPSISSQKDKTVV